MEIKKEITWKTRDGRKVVFTAALRTENVIGHDDIAGDIIKPCCEICYSATIEGEDVGGSGWLRTITPPKKVGCLTVVAEIGNLGIADVNYDRIMAAVEEIKSCDYYQKWQRKMVDVERVDREYREHVARVNDMMDE